MPTLSNITTARGIAGQISITATVTYPGEDSHPVTFVGSSFGGPVVMVTATSDGRECQTFVTDPGRFGRFEDDRREWLRRFFA